MAASTSVSGKSPCASLYTCSRRFLSAKAEKVATYVTERFTEDGSATVAFLIDEESNNNSASDNYIVLSELQKRLEEKGATCGDVLVVGETKEIVDKKTGETSSVTEDPTDANAMKKALEQVYDKVDVVINLAGLPNSLNDIRKITFLTRKNAATGKNNMIVMNDSGLPYVEQEMLKKGRVCAVIDNVSEAGANFDIQKDNAPSDLEEAFDYLYFFINPDTISNFIEENPNYFITK